METKRGEKREFKEKVVKRMLRGRIQTLALWCLLYREMIATKQREQLPSVRTLITIGNKAAKNIKGNVLIGKQSHDQP